MIRAMQAEQREPGVLALGAHSIFTVLSRFSCISYHTLLTAPSWSIQPEGVSQEEKSTKKGQETREDNKYWEPGAMVWRRGVIPDSGR